MDASGFVSLVSRFLLAATFLLAGLAKLRRHDQFETAVRGFRIIPRRFVRPISTWLPRFEIVCGAFLGLGVAALLFAALLAAALLSFTYVVALNLLRGREIDCGCFGEFAKPITWLTVARNVLLLGLAVFVLLVRPRILTVLPLLATSGSSDPTTTDALATLPVASLLVLGTLVLSRARGVWRSATSVLTGAAE